MTTLNKLSELVKKISKKVIDKKNISPLLFSLYLALIPISSNAASYSHMLNRPIEEISKVVKSVTWFELNTEEEIIKAVLKSGIDDPKMLGSLLTFGKIDTNNKTMKIDNISILDNLAKRETNQGYQEPLYSLISKARTLNSSGMNEEDIGFHMANRVGIKFIEINKNNNIEINEDLNKKVEFLLKQVKILEKQIELTSQSNNIKAK